MKNKNQSFFPTPRYMGVIRVMLGKTEKSRKLSFKYLNVFGFFFFFFAIKSEICSDSSSMHEMSSDL